MDGETAAADGQDKTMACLSFSSGGPSGHAHPETQEFGKSLAGRAGGEPCSAQGTKASGLGTRSWALGNAYTRKFFASSNLALTGIGGGRVGVAGVAGTG